MLRAGLIGFPSSGRSALFQLLTSVKDTPRSGGKSDANVGVARVPDERLDKLTALLDMGDRVVIEQGDSGRLPYDDDSFDGAYAQHVTMNVAEAAGAH